MERFDYKGTVLFLEKDIIDDSAFIEKGWYVQKALEAGFEYESALAMANIWINMKFNKCTYDKDIMKKVTTFGETI